MGKTLKFNQTALKAISETTGYSLRYTRKCLNDKSINTDAARHIRTMYNTQVEEINRIVKQIQK